MDAESLPITIGAGFTIGGGLVTTDTEFDDSAACEATERTY